jgi:CRP-like cAMP-binding protein
VEITLALLEAIANLGKHDSEEIATSLGKLSPTVLQDILEESNFSWQQEIPSTTIILLRESAENASCSMAIATSEIATTLTSLLEEPNPLIQSISLYLLQIVDLTLSRTRALEIDNSHPLVKETISHLKNSDRASLADFPRLERVVYLFNSDFFHSLDNEILLELSDRAYVKSFTENEHISEAGDTCRELLLLIEGNVEIKILHGDRTEEISHLVAGKILDELEVLAHTNLTGTITGRSTPTRVLAIPVDTFNDLMSRDRNLAIKVLELEKIRLRGLLVKGS